MASFRWLLQLHRDVPRAARFYSEGLDFSINVCTLRWAELQSGSLKLALMQSSSNTAVQNGYSSMLSFTVTDINSTVTKLMALGAELDGPIKYEIHGKVYTDTLLLPCDALMATCWVSMNLHDGNTWDGQLFNIGTRIPQVNILNTEGFVASAATNSSFF
ncbi:hypothetical protein Taro_025076 [Colocasia esculenta]|uniref:Glyoxalase/fosfomycin resistance/dioxygenase domain-containing protein n=1 Tax=Colocasia esculenta TaxID=4460 RepID=A0A843VMB9_COLES|nr:hypothetical protein [Colocasia esculenta]